jgi:hypothetical protein
MIMPKPFTTKTMNPFYVVVGQSGHPCEIVLHKLYFPHLCIDKFSRLYHSSFIIGDRVRVVEREAAIEQNSCFF